MTDMVTAEIYISGRVQGVGYRFFAEDIAAELKLNGYARNRPDGRVQIEVEGERTDVEEFISRLWKGPSMAIVNNVEVTWKGFENKFKGFSIRH